MPVAAAPAVRPLLSRITPGLALTLALTLVLALSARIQVPFWPVPMTLQMLAVLVIAALAGPRIATAAFVAYLIEGALGMPVFAGTPERGIGLAYMAGPTGGYLAGMLLAAPLVGWLAPRTAARPVALGGVMLLGIAVVYLAGAAWLSTFVGAQRAVALGVLPFLAGDAVKAALATALVLATGRLRRG